MSDLMLTGGGDWERYTFAGACNEPLPNSWKNACRRRSGHPGLHHTWDPRTGMNKGRHPMPFRDDQGRRHAAVDVWGPGAPMIRTRRMLSRTAYVAPTTTDRLMVTAIKSRERVPWS